MYVKRIPVKKMNDKLIYICHASTINGKKKDIYIEQLGLYSELLKEHNNPESFINERLLINSKKIEELKKNSYNLRIDYTTPLDTVTNNKRNASLLFLNKIWGDLTLESFFNKWKFDNNKKLKYSINDAARLMVFNRIINPGSKLHDYGNVNSYIEDFDLTIDNIYDSLDIIDEIQNKLTRKLNKSCEEIFENSKIGYGSIYYDCTNFYFEIQNQDGEEGIRAYGVEKNHRPDPIVEYGLLFHEDGYPIASATFRGNEGEYQTLLPLLKSADESISKSKIICADAGLNSSQNKEVIHSTGRNYVFSQSLKATKIDKDVREWAINGKDMIPYGEKDNKGRYKAYKSRAIIRSNGLEERLVVKYDPKSYDFMMKTILEREKHALEIIKNPSKLSLSKCSDGKQYIKKIIIDKNGEIVKGKSELVLSEEKINYEKSLCGYYAFVTDIPSNDFRDKEYREELIKNGLRCEPLDDIDIIKIGGKRVEIENCFRIMKTDMQARPIYVRKKEHISAHLFSVYMALTIICILKKKYLNQFTTDEIFTALRNYDFVSLDDLTYQTSYMDEVIKTLINKMSLDIQYKYIEKKRIRNIIATSKNRKRE